jgi:hypothetical protein
MATNGVMRSGVQFSSSIWRHINVSHQASKGNYSSYPKHEIHMVREALIISSSCTSLPRTQNTLLQTGVVFALRPLTPTRTSASLTVL